ncbi:G5 domain-containing protein [Bifidobacterium aquikefiri]|uniref:aggregation-promoting factor C-terminal-like domain-containing protein n=2 Tax=Bifidobacterium aquikefiri TaxID=1653207 RepID=UPI0039E8CA94
MARRWTPRQFLIRRRIRVAVCVVAVMAASFTAFGIGARKTVALEINGNTKIVQTYAMSISRLLQEQKIDVKTHDLVDSTSGNDLTNHDVVRVQSAYQTTINIDGQQVPFWTTATSMQQLLAFFHENQQNAVKVTVDIPNVYNQLTGGLVINKKGPVTVIADGKSSVAPNGELPAASILDSKGIVLGKNDRVSVETDNGTTILRVRRVKYTQSTKTVTVPHGTQTIVDNSLAAGETKVEQQGKDGEKRETFDNTVVDGVVESSKLVKNETLSVAIDTIIAVGPQKTETQDSNGSGSGSGSGSSSDGSSSGSSASSSGKSSSSSSSPSASESSKQSSSKPSASSSSSSTGTSTTSAAPKPTSTSKPTTTTPTPKPTTTTPTSTPSTGSGSSSGRLWHPTVAQAQTYAAGAAAQRGWTGAQWDAIVWIWNHESGWSWSAANSSGAYGIPQALPGKKMGTGWQDDGAVQIDWGLSYFAQRYGTPLKAKAYWLANGNY